VLAQHLDSGTVVSIQTKTSATRNIHRPSVAGYEDGWEGLKKPTRAVGFEMPDWVANVRETFNREIAEAGRVGQFKEAGERTPLTDVAPA
jgi:hypothetical protein